MPDGGTAISIRHRAARVYVARGWAVFPCLPLKKKPAITGGVHAATADIAQIDRWWIENPNYNIGFDPASAGLAVVDVDAKQQPDGSTGIDNWGKLVEAHGQPNTYWVRTPHDGWHIYFAGELPTTAGKIAPGIDTRGGGRGYVLLPPSSLDQGVPYLALGDLALSELPAGPYAPVPEWISQRVRTPRYQDQATREYVERSQKVPVPEDDLIERLSFIDPDCGYDEWFRYVGAIRATRLAGVSEEDTDARLLEIAQAWSRGDYWSLTPTRWTGEDDVEAKFWAMPPKPGGSTFGTLHHAARAAGCTKRVPRLDPFGDASQYLEYQQAANPRDDLGGEQRTVATPEGASSFIEYMRQRRREIPGYIPPPPAPICMTAAELDRYVVPPAQDTWQGLIPEQLVTLLYADGGVGKTLLDQWVAVHVAAGLPLFDRSTKKQAVVMVLCEDDYGRIQSSMRQICARVGVTLADLPITFYCTPEDPMLAVIEDNGEISHRPFLWLLIDKIASLGECLVQLDTVSDIAELNENLRLPVNSLCKRILQPICRELGATILVNCHPSEAQIKSGRMGSGTTAWKNAVRSRLVLIEDKAIEGWLTLSNKRADGGKSSYGESEPLRLKREGVIFSTAPLGKQIDEGAVHEGFVLMCAREAIRHAELFGRPVTRPNPTHKKSWNTWPHGVQNIQSGCEHEFGVVPGASHFWQHIHEAERRGYLRYLSHKETGGNKPAGYYAGKTPVPPRDGPH